jgi:hypothetical protein
MNMERLMEKIEREVRKMVKKIMHADDETLLECVREIIRDEQAKHESRTASVPSTQAGFQTFEQPATLR